MDQNLVNHLKDLKRFETIVNCEIESRVIFFAGP